MKNAFSELFAKSHCCNLAYMRMHRLDSTSSSLASYCFGEVGHLSAALNNKMILYSFASLAVERKGKGKWKTLGWACCESSVKPLKVSNALGAAQYPPLLEKIKCYVIFWSS